MGRSGRKRHYSRAERERFRASAEKAEKARKRARRRRRREAEKRAAAAGEPRIPRTRDPDKLVEDRFDHLRSGRKARLRSLIAAVLPHRPGLTSDPYLQGLAALATADWIRSPETWRPRGKGLSTAFHSLAAHMLGKYPVPDPLWDTLLFPAYWAKMDRTALRVVTWAASGRSLRKIVGTKLLPPPLTRRMLHILTHPPRPLPFGHMIRRAQVLGYGGTEVIADRLVQAGLDSLQADEEYWAEAIHWFCRQEHLTGKSTEEIVDYLADRWMEREALSLKGRSLKSLTREVAAYRRNRDASLSPRRKTARSDPAFGQWAGRLRCDIEGMETKGWEIRRIRTARQMILEGTIMHHCLATYRDELSDGTSSFWSLRVHGKRKLTIEVDTGEKKIETIAGKANRPARDDEMRVLRTWAVANGLEISKYA